jgi:hypothetical protein
LTTVPSHGTVNGPDKAREVGEEVEPMKLTAAGFMLRVTKGSVPKGAAGDQLHCPPDVQSKGVLGADGSEAGGEQGPEGRWGDIPDFTAVKGFGKDSGAPELGSDGGWDLQGLEALGCGDGLRKTGLEVG